MMVVFVSECEKKALLKTRRVLDAFADRIGERTWQTVITQEGLLAVKKLLCQTASKNTAVSCRWIRSRSYTEFLWSVGNKSSFDYEGKVPVNRTSKKLVIHDDLNDWQLLPAIRALTCLAALFHDWGKANARFQEKLAKDYGKKQGTKKVTYSDRLRHEWISCVLFKALINSTTNPDTDNDWLTALKNGCIDEKSIKKSLNASQSPLADLPDIAKLIAWLIVSHHKLPYKSGQGGIPCKSLNGLIKLIDKSWGYENIDAGELDHCVQFLEGLLTNSTKWLSQIKRWAGKILDSQKDITDAIKDGSYRVILHHARLALMLGDHYFSSLNTHEVSPWRSMSNLIANTQKDRSPKQFLDEHLVGVCQSANKVINLIPKIEKNLGQSVNTAELRRKSPEPFTWQNIAAKKIRDWRVSCDEKKKGFFAVNMASTGTGKTFGNAKIMMALSEKGDSLRYILALGLRTLTLQTGNEYRKRIFKKGDGSDLAVLIGSSAVASLHAEKEGADEETINGSESMESLIADNDQVVYEGELVEEILKIIFKNEKDKKLLYAPVLVCTIDHIIAATERTKGGRYILPALRLLSSDLVIDEIDDFTDSDLIAIGRLIHLAGMLGQKVMISSATIPPSLAEGYFNAYSEGWQLFYNKRNALPIIGCAWVDEFRTVVEEINVDKRS